MDHIPVDHLVISGCLFSSREFYEIMAATYNITIDKNADFLRTFQIKEDDVILDISGYTFAGALKENFQATTSTSLVTSVTDGPAGLFSISLADSVTATMASGNWVYDVVMTDTTGKRTRLFQGTAFVKQGVTT